MFEVLLGGGITLIVAVIFHFVASWSLKKRTIELEKRVDKVLSALEEAGLVSLVRQNGRITGIQKDGQVHISV
jgi:hypothetical protein